MKLDAHGGDLLAMASVSKRDPASLLDFSVNVRPEDAPEFLRAALVRANTGLAAYPSPNAEEALAAAARRYGLPAGRFAFGNGSNELIHALARVLKRRGAPCVSIVEPAPDALQRRSTAFADQIPCLAGGAHRLSGGLGRTG